MAQQECHLLSLPPELRTIIWDLCLISKDRYSTSPLFHPYHHHPLYEDCSQPALLHVCRQIRLETSQIHYGTFTVEFNFVDARWRADRVRDWFEASAAYLNICGTYASRPNSRQRNTTTTHMDTRRSTCAWSRATA